MNYLIDSARALSTHALDGRESLVTKDNKCWRKSLNTFLTDGVLCKLLYKHYREKNNQKSKDYFDVSNSALIEIY